MKGFMDYRGTNLSGLRWRDFGLHQSQWWFCVEEMRSKFGLCDWDVFAGFIEALCFAVLDNDGSHGGCARREIQAAHGGKAIVEEMMELVILRFQIRSYNSFRWFRGGSDYG
ncbi:hypothetical protein V8G54_009573 [Vigna mungo]|uniref:Uncharacterized protein n=1 Tax=Vigna mungo TaxID=3915 RepID=A0AAQ3S5L3_VIGMU